MNTARTPDRLPHGQVLTKKWPVLTYGETPRVNLETWTFRCFGLVEQPVSWSWPEFLKIVRQTPADFFDLARCDEALHHREDFLDDSVRIDESLCHDFVTDRCEESLQIQLLRGRHRPPSLEKQTAQQHRQLRREMSGLLQRQAVAQSLQHGAQRLVCVVCFEVRCLGHRIDPLVRLVHGGVEDFEGVLAHGGEGC